jgi:hypothetical protein
MWRGNAAEICVCCSGASALCTGDGGNLKMGIYNVDLFLQSYLTYAVRASCHATPPCASPSPSRGACDDHGTCIATSTTSACDCEAPWGDVGCDVRVPPLTPDQPLVVNALPWRSWHFYEVRREMLLPTATASPPQSRIGRRWFRAWVETCSWPP